MTELTEVIVSTLIAFGILLITYIMAGGSLRPLIRSKRVYEYSMDEKKEILRSKHARIQDEERRLNDRDCLVGDDKDSLDEEIEEYNLLRVRWSLQNKFPQKDFFVWNPVPGAAHVRFSNSK